MESEYELVERECLVCSTVKVRYELKHSVPPVLCTTECFNSYQETNIPGWLEVRND